jgi:hypothetical protein
VTGTPTPSPAGSCCTGRGRVPTSRALKDSCRHRGKTVVWPRLVPAPEPKWVNEILDLSFNDTWCVWGGPCSLKYRVLQPLVLMSSAPQHMLFVI